MATQSGTGSYLTFVMQSVFGTPGTLPATAPGNLRSGSVFTNPSNIHPRLSTGGSTPIASASQTWRSYLITDWQAGFEYTSSSAWVPLLTAAFGKVSGAATPWTYTCFNPYHGTTDATPLFYNHLLTIGHGFGGQGTCQTIQDACVSQFTLSVGTDAPATMQFSGKGHKFAAAATAPGAPAGTIAEVTGVVFPWNAFVMAAGSGVYIKAGTPALNTEADSFPLKKFTFTLDNDIQYEAVMATASGSELKSPQRGSLANAMIQVETVHDPGAASVDSNDIFSLFAAGTNVDFRAFGLASSGKSIDLKVTNQSGMIVSPKIDINGDGIVGMSFGIAVLPIALSDLSLVVTNT